MVIKNISLISLNDLFVIDTICNLQLINMEDGRDLKMRPVCLQKMIAEQLH